MYNFQYVTNSYSMCYQWSWRLHW